MEVVSGGKRVRKRVKLRSKSNVFVVLIVGIVLMLVTGTLSFLIINWQFEDKGQDALTLAKTIGSMPMVIIEVDATKKQARGVCLLPVSHVITG